MAMRLPMCSAPLLLLLAACATTDPRQAAWEAPSPRLANLQRAAQYPWTDDGQCAAVLTRLAAAVALCLFAAPEIVAGAVIVIGAVVVAAAIQEGIEAYQRNASRDRAKPKTQPSAAQEPRATRTPKPKGAPPGDLFPVPDSTTDRLKCEAIPVPRASQDVPHNTCADTFPPSHYPGMDVSVGGIRFDALQAGVRVLWEIKTHQFDTYNAFIQKVEIEKELKQLRKERDTALACGYDFVVGVSTQAHRDALLAKEQRLNIVVTGCTR